ncbi:MAG: insulinase family protein [Syntrophomonadaceae bacterium]|nr:insulinase family protein [Syntrophomonadaceae bacterium]
MLNYRKETLKNGVRIVTEGIPHVRSVSLGLWVRAGSRDEDKSNSGISHFIEHMMFKGTQNRTAREIAESLEAVGGQLNAFTAKEYTCYYVRVLDEHLDLAIDVLSDMFFNSRFALPDIDTERKVVLEEINMYEDSPDELIHDLFARTIWKDHSLGEPILGSLETIKALNREALLDYLHRHYTPDRLVIAAAGHLDHDSLVDRLRVHFEDWPGIEFPPVKNTEAPQHHAAVVWQKKDTEQIHLCLGVPGLQQKDDRLYTLNVLNNILGGGVSSRLFQEIREQRGLAYSVFSYHSAYRDSGILGVYAGTGPANVEQVIELLLKEIKQIRKQGVYKHELQRTQDQIKGGVYLGLESVSNRMTRLGKSELCYNRIIDPDEVIQKVQAIQPEEIQQLAEEIFAPEKLVVVSIGPGEQSVDLQRWINGNIR